MTENDSLKRFGAHQKAVALFDWVVADLSALAREPALQRLVAQQYASADSIAANIEEGYGRGSTRDYTNVPLLLYFCHREVREARRGDPDGLLRTPSSGTSRNDSPKAKGCWYYTHFLIIARGSAQETRGRYGRLKHWLPPEVIAPRVALCNEIIAILTATITTLRDQQQK